MEGKAININHELLSLASVYGTRHELLIHAAALKL